MLNKTEKKIMTAIFSLCQNQTSLLISPIDLISVSKVKDISSVELEKILTELSMDGYFDLVLSDRHGEKVYCIILGKKGKGFMRTRKISRRNIIFRIGLSAFLAVLSFIIGVILKNIF